MDRRFGLEARRMLRRAASRTVGVVRVATIGLGAWAAAGCTIIQEVAPASPASSSLCIVDAPRVKAAFRDALIKYTREKGFDVRVVSDPSAAGCPAHLTYYAEWSWDVVAYMKVATLTVFEGQEVIGTAHYSSDNASGNFAKLINAENKVAELIQSLFPAGPVIWTADTGAQPQRRR